MTAFNHFKPLIISTLGNCIEWYDFMVYAALAPIIATIFFPSQQGVNALLETYGLFAIGFIARPFGALLFGFLGDRFGRRYALLLAISLMTVPTFLIGCLPTYATIGLWAPLALLLCRLLQGLALSGEMPGCITFLSESAPLRLQTTLTSLAIVASLIGLLVGANGILYLDYQFGTTAVQSHLWRIPFLMAGAFGVIVYYLRRHLPETPAFLKQTHACQQPIRTCLRFHWRAIVQGIGCYAGNAIYFYFFMVFSLTYFYRLSHIPLHRALLFTISLQVAMLIMIPVGGYLADRYGRRKIGLIFLIIILISTYGTMIFMSQVSHYPLNAALFGLFMIAALIAGYSATLPALVASLFPIDVRFTGVAIVNNSAVTLFGGLSPLLITYLISTQHSLSVPMWPIMACTGISILSFWLFASASHDALANNRERQRSLIKPLPCED